MEDPFPYGPLVKPDGWEEMLDQAKAFGEGESASRDKHEQVATQWGWSLLITAMIVIPMMIAAFVGWLYSSWYLCGSALVGVAVYVALANHRECWQSLEDSIIEQLEQRPENFRWPYANRRRKVIVDCVAKVVAEWKLVGPPSRRALHPDDPVQLLFWGPCDDLSPASFKHLFESEFGLSHDSKLPHDFVDDSTTADDSLNAFVERCEGHLNKFGVQASVKAEHQSRVHGSSDLQMLLPFLFVIAVYILAVLFEKS